MSRINKQLNPENDNLFHLGFNTKIHNLEEMFGDVRVVCMGGSAHRMEIFAHYIMKILGHKLPTGLKLEDMTCKAHRYSFYKIGPVISVNHGMGMPSMSILLHEMIKLVTYAKCKDPIFIRMGTSGGLGIKPGTVVVTDNAFNESLENHYDFVVLGERVPRPAVFDKNLINYILDCHSTKDHFEVIKGGTMGTNDFYEAQGRTDGAVCEYTEEQKIMFLKKVQGKGIKNIEMESTLFAALTKYAGIRAATICVTFIDRLEGDKVSVTHDEKIELESRPQLIVGRLIKKILKIEE
ncbi:UPP1 family protein [Megaselia abdita]